MINILIFRTDRIGDLIVTCPVIHTIKQYFNESNIILISSEKNYNYAKSLNIFEKVYEFPKKNIINKFLLIKKLNRIKFDYIFIFDGKDRSIISASFIHSKNKVGLASKIKTFHKISKIKFFEDNEKTDLSEIFQKTLDYCKIKTKIGNYNFINNKKDNNFSNKIPINEYVHIHLDEKWFNNLYIKSFTDINPQYDEFVDLINSISEKKDILITTGINDTKLTSELINKFFQQIDKKIYCKKKHNRSIYLIYKPTFDDLESLLRKSKILIACHGAITHAANSFNIKKIDIIESSQENFYKRFTSYLSFYNLIYRENFASLKIKLLNTIKQ